MARSEGALHGQGTPFLQNKLFQRRFYQRGVSLTETIIMLPILLVVGLGILQYALIYQAKSSLNYATFSAARAGAFDHANPEALRIGFAKGLAPLYSPTPGEQGLLEAQRKVGEDILDGFVHFAIINPTTDAFSDFGEDLDLDGQSDDLPSLDLHAASTRVGSRSGVNIQDANLLKVHVTYGTRLIVPFVGPLFASLAQTVTDDPVRLQMLREGRLPIIASATVRMQNFATRNDLMLSRNEVAQAVRAALTPNPNPIDPPGNGTGSNGGGSGGNQPLPGEQLPGAGIGSGGGDDPFCAVTNTCSEPPPNNFSPIDPNPGPGQGNPMTCPAGVMTTGNPIHAVTGNKYQVETDLAALPGTLGLRFQRHYNSHDHQANVLGVGWRHSYSHRLVKQDNNRLSLINYDGRIISFLPEPATTQRSLIKVSQTPVSTQPKQWRAITRADGYIHYERATGYYHWQQHNGHEVSFDQAGQLIGLRAPNGANVNLYYSRQGQLQQVVDSQRRKLSFNYYPNGRLKTLIDPAGQRIRYSYDEQGNLDYVQHLDTASQNQTNQGKRQYHYEDPNDKHNLTGITDERGERYATWAYDSEDRAILSEHANGVERVSLDFSTPGQTLVTNSQGEQSVYHTTYQSGIPIVTAIAGPGCSTCGAADSQYVYNDGGQLTQSQNKDGLTTHYQYDTQGRLTNISVEDANGTQHQREQRSYQGNNLQPNQIHQPSVNPNGQHQRLLTYNDQQQLTKIEENGFSPTPDGDYLPITRTTTLTYDGQDLIVIDGPREDVDDILRLAYDRQHRLTTLISPDGRKLEITDYDAYGRATQIQTGEASPLTIQYNAQGQPTQVSQGPNTLSYEYSASGKLIGLTGPDGERVDIRYDEADRATRVIQANGPQLNLSYDTESRITNQSLSNANGDILSTINLLYDAEGRLREQRTNQNDNETIRNYEYDSQDRLTSLSNPQGDQLQVSYDPLGQLLGIANGAQTSQLEYDNKGQAISLTDANGNTTQQLKDDFGRIVALISPDSGTTQYRYDQAGNRIQKTNAEGQTDHFAYDAANRLIHSQTADGNTQYAYHESNGQLIQVSQQTETGQSQERFEYDKEGKLTAHHRDFRLKSNEINTLTTEYEYNAKGKLSHKHLPDGQTLRYHYYQDGKHRGQLRAITKETFFGQDVIIGEIDPNHWDGTLGYVFGNGLRANANYQNGQLQNQQDGNIKLVYKYDEQGNIIQIDHNGILNQYRYDQLGRLTYAKANHAIYRYQYDKLGNRLSKTVETQTTNTIQVNAYAEEAEGNRLKKRNNQVIDYNAAGSPKTYPSKQGVRSYDYNANQRPIRLYIDKQLRAEYEYNAFGERIRKTVYPQKDKASSNKKSSSNSNDDDGDSEPGQPITTYYLYDGRQLTAEVNDKGKVTKQYIYYKTAPVALLKKKTLYHIHSDHLGTPQQITDSKGKTVWQAGYSPFGKASINPDPDNDGKAITLNLRFAGQYEDQESGTYYNYFRDYDPETGRYITSDPIGLQGGLNTYAYVSNNPLSSIDPLGLMPAAAPVPTTPTTPGITPVNPGVTQVQIGRVAANTAGAGVRLLAQLAAGTAAAASAPVTVTAAAVILTGVTLGFAAEFAIEAAFGPAKPTAEEFTSLFNEIRLFNPSFGTIGPVGEEFDLADYLFFVDELRVAQQAFLNQNGDVCTQTADPNLIARAEASLALFSLLDNLRFSSETNQERQDQELQELLQRAFRQHQAEGGTLTFEEFVAQGLPEAGSESGIRPFTPFRSSRVRLDFQAESNQQASGEISVIITSNQVPNENGEIVGIGLPDANVIEGTFNPNTGDLRIDFLRARVSGLEIGPELVSRAIEEIGPDRVLSITGQFDLDNLRVFNEARDFGLSNEQAAFSTPAASIRQRLGFGRLEFDSQTLTLRGFRE